MCLSRGLSSWTRASSVLPTGASVIPRQEVSFHVAALLAGRSQSSREAVRLCSSEHACVVSRRDRAGGCSSWAHHSFFSLPE